MQHAHRGVNISFQYLCRNVIRCCCFVVLWLLSQLQFQSGAHKFKSSSWSDGGSTGGLIGGVLLRSCWKCSTHLLLWSSVAVTRQPFKSLLWRLVNLNLLNICLVVSYTVSFFIWCWLAAVSASFARPSMYFFLSFFSFLLTSLFASVYSVWALSFYALVHALSRFSFLDCFWMILVLQDGKK